MNKKIEDTMQLIQKRLDNWDLAKPIYAYIAELKLLDKYPNINIKDLLFKMSHADIVKLAEVISGKKDKYTISTAMEVIGCFLSYIFSKIATEPGYCDLLKLITVLPMLPQPKPENSTTTDLSAN